MNSDLQDAYGFELTTNHLLKYMKIITPYTQISKYPKIEREINLILSNALDSGEIITCIKTQVKDC